MTRWKRLVLVLLGLVTVAAAASVVAFLNWRFDDAESLCGRPCSPERLEQIEQVLGLNEPIHVQYWDYLRLVWDCRDLEPPAVRVDPNRSRCDQPELALTQAEPSGPGRSAATRAARAFDGRRVAWQSRHSTSVIASL